MKEVCFLSSKGYLVISMLDVCMWTAEKDPSLPPMNQLFADLASDIFRPSLSLVLSLPPPILPSVSLSVFTLSLISKITSLYITYI